ncbi:hypothetical protein Ddc_10750 [Ditylenchus destructor]|nr:hypothetical protein Ddc_10750 [Ditylenchus destructor]
MLNNIVNQNFAFHPLRIMPEIVAHLQIENSELVVMIRKHDSVYCLAPNARKWNICSIGCDRFHSVNVMRTFLRPNVRFRFAVISINESNTFTPYTTEHIATLESISHIWLEIVM